MKRYSVRLIPVVALVFAVAPLFAQGQGGFRFGGFGPSQLIRNKGVIEELKLSEDDAKKVQAAVKEVSDKYKDDLDTARKDENKEKIAELMKKRGEETSKILDGNLKPEQIKRLRQIEVQAGVQFMGPRSLTSARVEKEMNFTDKQKDAIKESAETLGKESRELMQDAGDDQEKRTEARKKIQTKTKETMEKISSTYTEDQKKAWKELIGAPFEYKPERRRPQI